MMAVDPQIQQAIIDAVDRPGSSQSKIARDLGVSVTMISQVCGGKYNSHSEKLEQAVRKHLLNETLECPVLGEVTYAECDMQQNLQCVPTSPQRIKLYRACRSGCQNYRGKE